MRRPKIAHAPIRRWAFRIPRLVLRRSVLPLRRGRRISPPCGRNRLVAHGPPTIGSSSLILFSSYRGGGLSRMFSYKLATFRGGAERRGGICARALQGRATPLGHLSFPHEEPGAAYAPNTCRGRKLPLTPTRPVCLPARRRGDPANGIRQIAALNRINLDQPAKSRGAGGGDLEIFVVWGGWARFVPNPRKWDVFGVPGAPPSVNPRFGWRAKVAVSCD